ncbi:MAG TPA: polyphosphate polymerase domain-containing protein [Myxococcota bacterium]|nr:polyphosphate polymerase domain-containing protein [Myxococcota bacterium]
MSEGRYELKYVLHETETPRLLAAIAGHVEPDRHASALPSGGLGYIVSSVYLDTLQFEGYAERLRMERIRNRVRVRTYGRAGDGAPVFLECKRKLADQVIKHRTRMGDADSYQLGPERSWDQIDDRRVQRFARAVQGMKAMCVVRYEREIFTADTARLTVDRNVRAGPVDDTRQLYAPVPLDLIPEDWCVIELKFNGQMPGWMRRASHELQLYSEPVSKFALGMVMSRRADHPGELRQLTPSTILRAA